MGLNNESKQVPAKSADLKQSSSSEVAWRCAYRHYLDGHLDQAESELRELLSNDPDNLAAVKLLGTILFSSKGHQAASEYIEHAAFLKPDDPDCCNNLGTLRWAQGRLDDAAIQFNKTVAIDPEHTQAYLNLGNVLSSRGDLQRASTAYRKALAIDPDSAQAWDSLGTLLQAQGKHSDAVTTFRKAISLAPETATYHANLAIALNSIGFAEAAIQSCQKAIEIEPKRAEFYLNLGNFLHKNGDLEEAVSAFRNVLKFRPDWGLAYNNLAAVLRDQGRTEDALASYQAASELEPDSPPILFNIGVTLHELEKYQGAVTAFEQVLVLKPDWAEAYLNLGNALYELGYTDETLSAFDRALELDDTIVEVHRNRGLVLQKLGRWEEALEALDCSVSTRPDDATTHAARGMLRLKLGDYNRGWDDYEWRFEAIGFEYLPDHVYHSPPWNGESFAGKTLLICHEQGLGDALQLLGYLPMIKARGGKVVILCGPPLMRLLENQDYVDSVLSRRECQELKFDFHVALMSMPHIFGTTLDSIPPLPRIDIDPDAIKRWGKRIQSSSALNVGLVWSGNPDQGDNHNRSCQLMDYAPLAKIEGIDFYSMQVGDEADQAKKPPEEMQIYDYSNELYDFVETAAFIRNLDLVITIDTSVAHMAGILGCPVWTVLWFNACYRYLIDRDDSPWYPSMRLFRQDSLGDWSGVMAKVAEELALLATSREEHLNQSE